VTETYQIGRVLLVLRYRGKLVSLLLSLMFSPFGTKISCPSWYSQLLRKDKAPVALNFPAASASLLPRSKTLEPVVG
jgi:hypothetical protein